MDTNQENFCVKTAQKCAVNIKSCYEHTKKIVQEKETSLKAKAKVYNENITALIAGQNQVLASVNQLVKTKMASIQAVTKVVGNEAQDLFVAKPALANSEFGVDLVAGGDLSAIEKMSEQVDKLRQTMQVQAEDANKKIEDEKAKRITDVQDMIALYQNVETSCKGVADGIAQQIQQEQQGQTI